MIRYLIPLLFLLFAFAPVAHAQRVVTDDEVNELSKGLYCPVCESEPLDSCGTQACIDWRAEIRVQLSEGRTKQEIYDDFVARYGERVLAQPSAQGLNLMLWLGAPLSVLVGGYLFLSYMRRIRTDAPTPVEGPPSTIPAAEPASAETIDDYLKRIEDELQADV